jgi:TRAP-type C4-dicarboxylate transport system permease small subunit
MTKNSRETFTGVMDKISRWIEKGSIALCIVCGAILVSITFIAVIFRYIIHTPIRWSEELARMLLIWIVFFGGNIAIREGRHLSLDFLENAFSPALKRILEMFSVVVGLIFFAIVFYTSLLMMNEIGSVARLSVIRVSMAVPYFALPAGAFLMVFQLINNMVQNIFKAPCT